MGRRYSANGDGWGSACRAADKLFLINGFSPGHLISLALGLKSNLTLCMSVNINKPLKKNKKKPRHSNVTHCVACGAGQESQFDGGVVVLLGEGQGQGEGDTSVARQKQGQEREKGKKREILFSAIHQRTAACFQKPVNVSPPPRLIQDHGTLSFFFSLPPLHLATYINPFPFNLVHCQPSLGYICVPLYLLMRSSEPGAWRWEGSGRSVR